MTKCIRGGFPAVLAVCAVAAPAASAAPVTVNLRVEGATQTIFEGPVTTDVHQTTTPSDGQARTCDGSTVGSPVGPTAISALDDAARTAGFVWDARWDSSFNDYYPFLRVGPDEIDASHYPALYVNWAFAQVGGCGQRVSQGDDVLWAYEDFNPSPALRLSGPGSAATGQSVQVRVVDGLTGTPTVGATVAGAATGADGTAAVSFADPGVYRLKAEKPDAIRSNALTLCVDPLGADPCTSSDRSAPTVRVTLPGRRLASEGGQSRTLVVAWAGDDAQGAGISRYAIDVREVASGVRTGQAQPGDWRSITESTTSTSARFRGDSGKAYQFRVSAVDRAANRASVETDPLILPVDDRDRKLWRLSRGWKRIRNEAAWGRTVVRAKEAGARGTFRFNGRTVVLIGRKLRRGGRLRVTVDGRSRVLRLRGRTSHRSVLWTSRRLRSGAHSLAIRSLGGGTVELDAVAPLP
jgi:hypothetical protein